MQKSILILLSFLFSSAYSYAQQCQSLFLPTTNTIYYVANRLGLFANNETLQEIHDKQSKDLFKTQDREIPILKIILEKKNISYKEEIYDFTDSPSRFKPHLIRLVIEPNEKSFINKIAKRIFDTYGFSLVLDPAQLQFDTAIFSVDQQMGFVTINRSFLQNPDTRNPTWLHEMRHLNSIKTNKLNPYFINGESLPFSDHYIHYSNQFSYDEIRAHLTEAKIRIFQLTGTKRDLLENENYLFNTSMTGYILANRAIQILKAFIKNEATLDGQSIDIFYQDKYLQENPQTFFKDPLVQNDFQKLLQEAFIYRQQFEAMSYLIAKEILFNNFKPTTSPEEIKARTLKLKKKLISLLGKWNTPPLLDLLIDEN